MAYQKTVKGRILTLVMCAVVALSVMWCSDFVSYAVNDNAGAVEVTVPYTYLSPGIDNCVTVAFPGYLNDIPAGSYEFLIYCAPYYVPKESVEGVTYYFDNLRIVMHGVEYPATYQSPANYVLQGTFDCNGIAPHYTILADLHRISRLGGGGHINFYGSSKTFGDITGFWYSTVPLVSESGTIDRDPLSSTKYNYRVSIPQYNVSSTSALALSGVETFYNDLSASTLDVAMFDAGGTMYLNKQSLTVTAITRVTQQVTDSTQQQLTQQQTEQQHQDAQDQLEEQKKQTAIAEEQKETTKGIFGKISSFFASFFENIINAVSSMVLPDSDELMAFLDEVNIWFGDRLGFIYYPFDLAVQLVQAFAGGDANQQFTVPALTLNILGEQYAIWESFTIDLDAMGIFVYVRYFTSAMLCLGVGKLAIDKWDDWIGGKRS